MYYSRDVYNINEDFTSENMKYEDIKREKRQEKIREVEKELGRKLTLIEIYKRGL